ncbi:hypothetical protein H4R35_003576 [Dimargaris xerosporica]|nr:hypothetical protein H4R35_003576 [Dimargaris xerosporica]
MAAPLLSHLQALWSQAHHYAPSWKIAAALATNLALVLVAHIVLYRRRQLAQWRQKFKESSFIQDHCQFKLIRDTKIRLFFCAHPRGTRAPLFFFIHGVNSNLAVWEKQMERLQAVGNILAVDLVGHGESERPTSWEPYTTASLVEDLKALIMDYTGYPIIMIGHSYGNCLAVKLYPAIRSQVVGLVLIAPGDVTHPPHITRLLRCPEWIINVVRRLDRYGGTESTSVRRMVYTKVASPELKEQQLYWNSSSSTSVFRRVMLGMQWLESDDLQALGDKCPILLLPGEFDPIHPVTCSYAVKECVPSKRATIVVAHQAAHQVQLEKPGFTNQEILRFVGEECGFADLVGI